MRSPGGVRRHAGKASAAACTAASTSAEVESGVRASNSAVAGLVTSTYSVGPRRSPSAAHVILQFLYLARRAGAHAYTLDVQR